MLPKLKDRGIWGLTFVHKLTGLAWLIGAGTILWLAATALASGKADYALISRLARIGSTASVITMALGVAYHLFTVWGFAGSRVLWLKWGLYLVAVSASGYTIRAAREADAALLAALAAVQVVLLAAAMGSGVYLELGRKAGRLPRTRA